MAENQEFEEVTNGATEEMTEEQYEEAMGEGQQEEAMQQEGGENGDDKAAQENLDDRKIFVGGLSHETNDEHLKSYFEKFGEVENAELKVDPISQRSRGFGFVTFKDAATIKAVLEHTEGHTLQGKQIDPKQANPRPSKEPKIFVGGVDAATTEEDLKTHFSQFGPVKEVVLPFDPYKKQRRPYVFVTFETIEGSNAAIAKPKQKIGEKECDVNEATPQQDKMGGRGRGFRGGFRGGPRGRGRGRGRYDYYGYDYGYDYYNQGYYDYYGYDGYYGNYDYNNYYGNYGYGYDGYDWNNYYGQGYDQSGASGEQQASRY